MIQFVFVQHGETTKSEKDEYRKLTEVGELQASQFRVQCDRRGIAPFDLVLTSPETQAKQTGAIIAPQCDDTVVLPELGTEIPGRDGERFNEVYAKLKYVPLDEYMRESDMKGILLRYAYYAYGAITTTTFARMSRKWEGPHPECVLVVGHAVLLNAIGTAFVYGEASRSHLSFVSLDECDGFLITDTCSAGIIRRRA